MGFPCGPAGKESAYNVGELGSIPGLGRYPGEGIGYPLQYSWLSLVAQMVKNLPAMQETWIQSLAWTDPLEECMATHSSILAWRIPIDRGAWWPSVHGVPKSWTWLSNQHFHFYFTFHILYFSVFNLNIQVSHIFQSEEKKQEKEKKNLWIKMYPLLDNAKSICFLSKPSFLQV